MNFGLRVETTHSALLDRLTHHVYVLEMNCDSFRLVISKKAQRRADPAASAKMSTEGGEERSRWRNHRAENSRQPPRRANARRKASEAGGSAQRLAKAGVSDGPCVLVGLSCDETSDLLREALAIVTADTETRGGRAVVL